jgi:hypothetical protein
MVVAALGTPVCAGEDCNGDGIPDDQLGLGRLFFDTFPWTTIDSDKWAFISSATIDDVGLAEPTEPYALRLDGHPDGGDTVESIPIDLSATTAARLIYSWERTGGAESPDAGDDLFVECADATGTWITLAHHLGSGPDMTTFTQAVLDLPPGACHSGFVLRFRNVGSPGVVGGPFDNWFVDDVFIVDGVPDCNANGVPDDCDIDDGTSLDCNANGIPDECDVGEGVSADCNGNDVPDECDIGDGFSEDVNGDYVPDECQDCNTNGVLDPNDIVDGTSADCNANGIPDECDLADGTSDDCDANGVPDECDIAAWSYRVDDGTLEGYLWAVAGGGFIWLNEFTIEPGAEHVVAIDVAWGKITEGTPTTVALWIDPDQDGDPTNADLLVTAGPFPAENPGTNRWVRPATCSLQARTWCIRLETGPPRGISVLLPCDEAGWPLGMTLSIWALTRIHRR